jgi:hypothetical protein
MLGQPPTPGLLPPLPPRLPRRETPRTRSSTGERSRQAPGGAPPGGVPPGDVPPGDVLTVSDAAPAREPPDPRRPEPWMPHHPAQVRAPARLP